MFHLIFVIKQFIKKNNLWYERNIKISEKYNPEIVDIYQEIKKVEKKIGFNISYKQNFIEYSPLSKEYLKIIAKKINKNNGGILIIDYGYWEHKMKCIQIENVMKTIKKILENLISLTI